MKVDHKVFAKELQERAINQSELGRQTKYSRSAICGVANGRTEPGKNFMQKMSNWFEMPVDILFPKKMEVEE